MSVRDTGGPLDERGQAWSAGASSLHALHSPGSDAYFLGILEWASHIAEWLPTSLPPHCTLISCTLVYLKCRKCPHPSKLNFYGKQNYPQPEPGKLPFLSWGQGEARKCSKSWWARWKHPHMTWHLTTGPSGLPGACQGRTGRVVGTGKEAGRREKEPSHL